MPSIQVSDTIGAAGSFAVVDSKDVAGANQSVATLTDRDAIPAYLRLAGMLCYVVETQLFYVLSNDLINWVEWTGGSVQPTKLIKSFDHTQAVWVIGTTGNVVIQEIVIQIIEPFDATTEINVTANNIEVFSTTEINVTANNIEVFSSNLVRPNHTRNYTTGFQQIDASDEFQIHISNATQGRGRIFIQL